MKHSQKRIFMDIEKIIVDESQAFADQVIKIILPEFEKCLFRIFFSR